MLTRDRILGAPDLKAEEVFVPEWSDSVLVRGMTGAERDRFESSFLGKDGKLAPGSMQNLRALMARMCCVDEQGKHIFTDADVVELGKKSASALQRIFEVAQRLSGLSSRAIEELTKN